MCSKLMLAKIATSLSKIFNVYFDNKSVKLSLANFDVVASIGLCSSQNVDVLPIK